MGTRMYYTIKMSAKKECEHSTKQEKPADNHEHKYKIEVSAVRHKEKEDGDEIIDRYISAHGHHFTKELAEAVVDKFVSVNPKIPFEKTEEMLKHSDDKLPEFVTMGDLHVMVNEIRATHSTLTVRSDVHALSLALEKFNSPNKESDDLFDDWVDILARRKEDIDWEKYV